MEAGKLELKQHSFDLRRRKVEGQYFLILLLEVYFKIFQVFRLFLDRKLKIYDETWERRINKLEGELSKRHAQYNKLYNAPA